MALASVQLDPCTPAAALASGAPLEVRLAASVAEARIESVGRLNGAFQKAFPVVDGEVLETAEARFEQRVPQFIES